MSSQIFRPLGVSGHAHGGWFRKQSMRDYCTARTSKRQCQAQHQKEKKQHFRLAPCNQQLHPNLLQASAHLRSDPKMSTDKCVAASLLLPGPETKQPVNAYRNRPLTLAYHVCFHPLCQTCQSLNLTCCTRRAGPAASRYHPIP